MSFDMQDFQAGWKALSSGDLRAALPRQITLDDIPLLPLARASDMPAQAGFARGALGIDLAGLQLTLAADSALTLEQDSDAQGRCVLTLRLQDIALQGRQTLQGTQIWETGVDSAGTGLPPNATRRGGADQKHPAWIQTANDQRAALQNTPGGNGATMLSTYANHRAAFNDAFSSPGAYSFWNGWRTHAISAMAEDTHTALTQGGVVNDPNKQYGGTTYNGHAQTQQLSLMTALTAMAGSKDETNPFNQAAAATLTFSSGIVQNTKAQKINDVPAQTKDSVYQLVQNGTQPAPHSAADVHAFLSGSPIGGRDAQGNVWTMCLTEDERTFVRKMQADIAEHMARLAAQKPVALVAGKLHAQLGCYVYLQFGADDNGAPCLLDGRVELDGFDLDFDDSAWDQALGLPLAGTAREALSEARFIKSLLHDRIADALERALVQPLAQKLLSARQ